MNKPRPRHVGLSQRHVAICGRHTDKTKLAMRPPYSKEEIKKVYAFLAENEAELSGLLNGELNALSTLSKELGRSERSIFGMLRRRVQGSLVRVPVETAQVLRRLLQLQPPGSRARSSVEQRRLDRRLRRGEGEDKKEGDDEGQDEGHGEGDDEEVEHVRGGEELADVRREADVDFELLPPAPRRPLDREARLRRAAEHVERNARQEDDDVPHRRARRSRSENDNVRHRERQRHRQGRHRRSRSLRPFMMFQNRGSTHVHNY